MACCNFFVIGHLRIEILDVHKLKVEHFTTMKDALEAADIMVSALKKEFPEVMEAHPDILVPKQPLLDQFWYFKSEGTACKEHHTPIKLYMIL